MAAPRPRPTPLGSALAAAAAGAWASWLALGSWPAGLAAGLATVLLAASYGRALREALAARRLVVERRASPARGVDGSRVRVRVRVRNPGAVGLSHVRIVDPGAPRLRPRGVRVAEGPLPAGAVAEAEYEATLAPGRHDFEPVRVEAEDPLGLWVYTVGHPAPLTVRASPSVSWLEEAAPWLPGAGGRPVRARGRGLEFYEVREYQPGDDPRRIVWTATARTGRLMVREDEPEASVRLHVLLDLSLESWVGEPGEAPGDYIARLAAGLLALAARAGGRAGYTILYGPGYKIHPPATPHEALASLAADVSGYSPSEAGGRAALAPALRKTAALAEWGVLALLLGPGALRDEAVEAIRLAVSRVMVRPVVVVVTPGGSGTVADAVHAIESYHARRLRPALEAVGARVAVARGPAALEAYRLVAAEVTARPW